MYLKNHDVWIHIPSIVRGGWIPFAGKVNYGIALLPKKCWMQIWTPKWHKRRGPYITIGLWLLAFYRGY